MEDVVKALGYVALGTRLKRIGERLQAQAQVIIDEHGSTLPAGHFSVLAALGRLGALNVGELAQAIGVTQPAISRIVERLEADALLETRTSADRRARTVTLSRAGRRVFEKAQQVIWPRLESAVADACAGPRGTILEHLSALESALDALPLHARVARSADAERKHARP